LAHALADDAAFSCPLSDECEDIVSGHPVTFAASGTQYVAVMTGPSIVSNSALRLTPELHPSNTSAVFVFALP